MIVAELLVTAAGVLVMVIGRGTATGRIGRNAFAGIRTRRSMADDESWLIVHRCAQPWMVGSGAVMILAGAVAAVVPGEAASGITIGVGSSFAVVWATAGAFTGLRALGNRTR